MDAKVKAALQASLASSKQTNNINDIEGERATTTPHFNL